MFLKLSQRSTAWWVCVAITCVFSASLLTVLIYPVYAQVEAAVCNRDICGGHNGCGPCGVADGLGTHGGYEIEAAPTSYSTWVETNGDCKGRVSAYHSVYVDNQSGEEADIEWFYKAIFFQPGGGVGGCAPRHVVTNSATHPLVTGSYSVNNGNTFTNTYTQSQDFWLGNPGTCTYSVQAVTELIFPTGLSTDAQGVIPKNGFVACPQD